MKLFSVYDRKAKEFGPLFEAKNEEVAIRQFKNMLASERMLSPEDYSLHSFGEFDRENGHILLEVEGNFLVFAGVNFVESKNAEVLR